MITQIMNTGSKLGIDATKKIPGEGFKRAWPRDQDGGKREGEGGKNFLDRHLAELN